MGCSGSSGKQKVEVPAERRRLSVGIVENEEAADEIDIREEDRGLLSALDNETVLQLLEGKNIKAGRRMSIGTALDAGKEAFANKAIQQLGDAIEPVRVPRKTSCESLAAPVLLRCTEAILLNLLDNIPKPKSPKAQKPEPLNVAGGPEPWFHGSAGASGAAGALVSKASQGPCEQFQATLLQLGCTELPAASVGCIDLRAEGNYGGYVGEESFKKKRCYFFDRGGCIYGDSCNFKHSSQSEAKADCCSAAAGDAGYHKKNLCSLFMLPGLECPFTSSFCWNAHGPSELRRRPLCLPPLDGIKQGTRLRCISSGLSAADASEVWRSPSEWVIIGHVKVQDLVLADGAPALVDGYMMVPIQPAGAVELRYFSSEPDEKGTARDLPITDAHIHLDEVLRTRRFGFGWYAKALRCSFLPNCTQMRCLFAHENEKLRSFPALRAGDLASLRDEVTKLPGARIVGIVQSCCGAEVIEDTLQLVKWGREMMDGRIYATFGIHPNDFEAYTSQVQARLEAALDTCGAQGVGWGECGLDFNKRADELEAAPELRQKMRQVFIDQIHVALKRGIPLVVHSRDAEEEVFHILDAYVPREHYVQLHSFMGSASMLLSFLAERPNTYVSVPGALTWAWSWKDGGLRELAKVLPVDRLLLETDGPYMAPAPYRGQDSHPGHVPWVAHTLAVAKGLRTLEVLEVASSRKGLKPESPNQDSWFCLKVEQYFSLYAVFDGHGSKGHKVSQFVKDNLPKLILMDERFGKGSAELPDMLKENFQKTQDLIIASDKMGKLNASLSGTTATLVVHDHESKEITVAHVADSSSVLGRRKGTADFEAEQLTRDHKPNLKDEKARIEKAGGMVVFDGYANHRIYARNARHPGLNMSRCLGDLLGHQTCGISAVPEARALSCFSAVILVYECKRYQRTSFLLLVCCILHIAVRNAQAQKYQM
ncbi:TATDN2 [Symbiodinium sp. CCMP2456]|nr:TATDN2 [Symbiodinium sp. CCMP2456]